MRFFGRSMLLAVLEARFLSLSGLLKTLWVLLGVLFILIRPVQAEVWVLTDEKGVTHFSSEQKDARYQLFFHGAGLSGAAGAGLVPEGLATAALPPVSDTMAVFEWSSRYPAVHHHLHEAAGNHDIDLALLQALVATESSFHTGAVSPQGAVGLMQLMPSTARLLGLKGEPRASLQRKLIDPGVNVQMGSRYLRYLINLFPGQIELALAAYNAGEGTVKRAGNRLGNLKKHTRHYVQTVMQLYGQLKPGTAGLTPRSAPASPPTPIQSPE